MSGYQQQARVLLAELTECVSGAGRPYLRGWLGASNLVAFEGEPDEQGRRVWRLYLAERQPRQDAPQPRDASSRGPRPVSASGEAPGRPGGHARRQGNGSRKDRAAREVAERYGLNEDPSDAIPF